MDVCGFSVCLSVWYAGEGTIFHDHLWSVDIFLLLCISGLTCPLSHSFRVLCSVLIFWGLVSAHKFTSVVVSGRRPVLWLSCLPRSQDFFRLPAWGRPAIQTACGDVASGWTWWTMAATVGCEGIECAFNSPWKHYWKTLLQALTFEIMELLYPF